MSRARYLPNDTKKLLSVPDARGELVKSLTSIVQGRPPRQPDAPEPTLPALWFGPLSLAYLFLWLSKTHLDLVIEGKQPQDWCAAYLNCMSARDYLSDADNTIDMEYLTFIALKVAVNGDMECAEKLKTTVMNLDPPAEDNELLFGRAGILVLLRVVRHFVPRATSSMNEAMNFLIQHILAHQPWTFYSTSCIGAAHGSIGIITQIVLSLPSYASQVQSILVELLDEQNADGSWGAEKGQPRDAELVQWCHGSPGFVLSLLKLRPYFPSLEDRIDKAIALGRKNIWERGLLTKEPTLCHGISGNALALATQQRDHFLTFTTNKNVKAGIENVIFEESDDKHGLLFGEGGRAWAWMAVDACRVEEIGFPGYTDV